jgi:lipoyl(octanoyl) transferase
MEKQYISKKIEYIDLGTIDYKEAWELQQRTFELRTKNEIDDILYLLEHPHTYTLGKVADKNNLITTDAVLKEKQISVYDIDRGGDITYHGPGQIVGYPIIDLKNWKQDTHEYLRNLEEVIISVCKDYGIETERNPKYTGVWVGNRKIAAIGIKVSRWITMHGFAFNISTDLGLFDGIIPCGIKDKEVTSLSKELGRKIELDEVKEKLLFHFIRLFDYTEKIENQKKGT